MQRTELVRKLRKGGWEVLPGGRHGMAKNPNRPGEKIPVPNGSKINDYTAKEILRAAGLE